MSTIREHIGEALDFFAQQQAVVATCFNVGTDFLENKALPVLLGAEGGTREAVRQHLHDRLAATDVTIYYDPTAGAVPAGDLRYVARPVPLRGRLFHPKVTVIAGVGHDDRHWVYLAVASANLTRSGWAHNAECVGETWICTPQQQTWGALDGFLGWLQDHAAFGEHPDRRDATRHVREILAAMPNRRRPNDDGGHVWSGTLYHQLYTSVVDTGGFPAFLQEGRSRRPSRLWAYSPYWADVERGVAAFGAAETVLIPSLTHTGDRIGLARGQVPPAASVASNPEDRGDRFWHMKSYWIEHGGRVRTAVGSCNFTTAGLSGGFGNVEAMLVTNEDAAWLPEVKDLELEAIPQNPPDETAPEPAPVAVVVAWDWRDRTWRWWLGPGHDQTDFRLEAPGLDTQLVEGGQGRADGDPPPPASSFALHYWDADGPQTWTRPVVEINLASSQRVYGRPLTVDEIIASWNGRRPATPIDDDDDGVGTSEADETAPDGPDVPIEFGTVNLFDFYRSMTHLRKALAEAADNPGARRALLEGRPDSVMTLVRMTTKDSGVPAVRFLVLTELAEVLHDHQDAIDAMLLDEAADLHTTVTDEVRQALAESPDSSDLDPEALLAWVNRELKGLGGSTS